MKIICDSRFGLKAMREAAVWGFLMHIVNP